MFDKMNHCCCENLPSSSAHQITTSLAQALVHKPPSYSARRRNVMNLREPTHLDQRPHSLFVSATWNAQTHHAVVKLRTQKFAILW
jgi:hypothetical protein